MIKLKDGRAELYQWDTGRVLSVPKECTEVHYSNKLFGRSLDVDVVDGAAIIPDVLLQTAKPISVWCFVGTAENGFTKVSKQFDVLPRNKPAEYVFTPTEQLTLRELEQRVEKLEKTGGGGGGSGEPGEDGEDGGYYTPAVTQPNANTMRMEFVASKADMPPVAGVEITLPGGGGNLVTQEELSALETRMNEIHTDLSEATGRVEEQMSDVARDVSDLETEVGNKYTKPEDGIPTSDLAEQTKAYLVDAVLAALPVWEGGSY